MLIHSIKTSRGDIVHLQQEGGVYHAKLSFGGTSFSKEVALTSPLPFHQALSNLLSCPPRAELHYDRTSGNLVILPKGGLAGGKDIEDLIKQLEYLLKSADYGEKLADALIQNNLDPNNIPKNYAKQFLEIAVKVLAPDPIGEFAEFRDELAKMAEDRIAQFANRLAKSRALDEAWIRKHQGVQEKQRLRSFISRTEQGIQEKEKVIGGKQARIATLENYIRLGKEAIAEAESALNRVVQGRTAKQNRTYLEKEKAKIEKEIEKAENFKAQYPSTAPRLDAAIARLRIKLAEVNRALENVTNFITRYEGLICTTGKEMAKFSKEKDENVRCINHLQIEISSLRTEISKAENKLSNL